jgi:hypothetical protein
MKKILIGGDKDTKCFLFCKPSAANLQSHFSDVKLKIMVENNFLRENDFFSL